MQDEIWFLKPWVWMDYRLAVLFAVFVPLGLLIWSLVRRSEAITRLLVIYWRVASLLMITVYLMIPAWSIAYVTGFMARILIPIALWFWVDINDEIEDMPGSRFKLWVTGWRWAMTVYCTLGALVSIPTLSCAFSRVAFQQEFCQVWLEAPLLYKSWFHRNTDPGILGFFGVVALVVYGLYLGYFLVVRLARQGRIAIEQ
ncbi:DUF3177 family protein [Spirulina subsalsa FACHB-351]|uniref:DUF3177 family protein n=1 Tax=Spirulina subsalsa FACHB-351 TaxID=234711 RepID=A0ABT3L5H6_9CYAN|nr:DUF3177 family protein [Spirulina subsalsa]MCW6036265.1 DUF3177 family protein [Spirulina subsalsa FACHB-351]